MKKKTPKSKTKKIQRAQKKMGKAPGTITYLGQREGAKSVVNILDYNETTFEHHKPGNLDQIVAHREPPLVSWIDVVGLSDETFIEKVGKRFGLNPLVMEDTVNTQQRPKIDEYEHYIFGVFKMLYLDEDNQLVTEHVALVLMKNCVLVFQELEDDVFNGVRERIRTKSGRIRSRGADYLFFALIDAIVDHYFVVLEHLNEQIELLEDEVYENPTKQVANKIQELKKQVLKVRRWVSPVKELVSRLIETEHPLITKDTKLFLRDVQDHSTEINETIQIYREMTMSLMEMYMSNMSNRMNEVMKVLTIMASIFIPLTFIAGIYGMNFKYMPELEWHYGYYMVWAVMVALFVGMLIFFKKKGWL
ncbi:MAG: magnesium and cobalt transport protein CorA [Muricauda sp.]|nr:magnesium/cobalt transporter CorA [Allomuricauda sp.]MBC29908.1 magnesium and cobalt transport protein CorA [Allomuricauda sp.]|tara:strand:+ start:26260 stop:27345 length:1086 start_codon:yes stop_codon:yes gene_type:complete